MTAMQDGSDCPYVGLQPFHEADRQFFFGRERDQRIIIANLLAAPLTVLYGSSGVGKSSVLMAGVVPQLRRERPRTPVIVFREWVGDDFRLKLIRACIAAVWQNDIADPKPAETLPLDEVLRACSEAAHGTVLIIFDQFEEYFLYHPKSADPESFEAQLARAINREDVEIGLVIALREDSLSKLDRFQERIPHLMSNRLRLNHLDTDGARAAIRGPLDVWNSIHGNGTPPVVIEETLVDQLIEQVRIGQLSVARQGGTGGTLAPAQFIEAPFLQLVLTRLWSEEVAQKSSTLRLVTLERLKGAKEIVRTHLDNVMAALDETARAVCATFFDRLVTPSGTKVACSRDDLTRWAGDLAPHVDNVLGLLHDRRILRTVSTSAEKSDVTNFEIYHDVLAPAILEWQRQYSETQRQRSAARQARRRIAGASLIALVALAGWIWTTVQGWRVSANQMAAESLVFAQHNPERGLDRAVAAVEELGWLGPTELIEQALRESLKSHLLWSHTFNGRVFDVAFTPSGAWLATEGKNNSVQMSTTGLEKLPAAAAQCFLNMPQVVELLPGGGMAISAGTTTMVWREGLTTAEPLLLEQGAAINSLLDASIEGAAINRALALSRDGTRIATANGGRGKRVIYIWDVSSGSSQPIATIDMENAWVMGLAFSPDGHSLATAHVEQGKISRTFAEIWDVQTQSKLLRVQNDVPSDVVAFAPDGKALVTASRDGRIRIWQPRIGSLDALIATRSEEAANLSVVTECAEPTLSCASMKRREPGNIDWFVRTLNGHSARVRDIAISPDGGYLASTSVDHTVVVWNLETGEHVLSLAGHLNSVDTVAFGADGQELLTGSQDGTLKLWNIAHHTGAVHGVAFSPSGDSLATASSDRTAKLWHLSSGTRRLQHTLVMPKKGVRAVAYDPTGQRVVTAGLDNVAQVWDATSGDLLKTLKWHKDELRGVAYSPDGKYIATVSAHGTAYLHLAEPVTPDTKDEPVELQHNRDRTKVEATAVAFNPRRQEWATGGSDGKIQLWDYAAQPLGTITHPDAGSEKPPSFVDVSFSPDGTDIVAVARNQVFVWEAAGAHDPKPKAKLIVTIVDAKFCNAVAYSPGGERLAVGCDDASVRIYDMSGTPLQTITVHTVAISDVAFSPDGTSVASASLDGTFQVSPLRFEDLFRAAKQLQIERAK